METVCPNCGNKLEPNAQECHQCNASFANDAAWRPIARSPEPKGRAKTRADSRNLVGYVVAALAASVTAALLLVAQDMRMVLDAQLISDLLGIVVWPFLLYPPVVVIGIPVCYMIHLLPVRSIFMYVLLGVAAGALVGPNVELTSDVLSDVHQQPAIPSVVWETIRWALAGGVGLGVFWYIVVRSQNYAMEEDATRAVRLSEPTAMTIKRKSRRIVFSAVGVLAIFIVAAWGLIEFEPLRHDALTYETPPSCASTSTPWNNKLTAHWEQDVFLIRASEFPNCAEFAKQVSAQVIGGRVLLRIRYEASGPLPACKCEKLTITRLSELAKRDYVIMRIDSP